MGDPGKAESRRWVKVDILDDVVHAELIDVKSASRTLQMPVYC